MARGESSPATTAGTDAMAETRRSHLKQRRRRDIVLAARRLFAERGFLAVSIEDLGTAVGISGPAVYRYFPSKEAILSELLVRVSEGLLEGGRREVIEAVSGADAIRRLIAFHTEFALRDRELIRIQDRDLQHLPPEERRSVRRLQRAYVEVWVEALVANDTGMSAARARTMAHAAFGLLNSTPHSATGVDLESSRQVLVEMAARALLPATGAMPRQPATAATASRARS